MVCFFYDYVFGLDVPEWAKLDNGQVEIIVSFYDDVSFEEHKILRINTLRHLLITLIMTKQLEQMKIISQ